MSESNQEEIDELESNLESETTEQTPIQPTGGTNTNLTVPSMADRTFAVIKPNYQTRVVSRKKRLI